MAKTPAEVRALIDQIAAEQESFRSKKGSYSWLDDLSADTQARIEEMGWPPEIVVKGKDDLENWAKLLHQL